MQRGHIDEGYLILKNVVAPEINNFSIDEAGIKSFNDLLFKIECSIIASRLHDGMVSRREDGFIQKLIE